MQLISAKGNIDLFDNFSYSLNYTTADIVNLTGRKTNFSKTIKVPLTSNNALIFQGVEEANSDNVGYNFKKGLPAVLINEGSELLSGVLIVLGFNDLKEEKEIELQLVGKTKTLISALKDVKLNELDFSYLNHEYNLSNIINSYSGINVVNGVDQFRNGYIYPLVDYGKDDTVLNKWSITDLRPCLYLKEIVDKLFLTAGKSYKSNFFNSPYFNQLVILNTLDKILLTEDQLEPYNSEVNNSVEQFSLPNGNVGVYHNIQNSEFIAPIDLDTVVLDNFTTWNLSNPNNPTCTIEQTGKYKLRLTTELNIDYALDFIWILANNPAQSNPLTLVQGEVINYLQLYINGSVYDSLPVRDTPLNTTWFQQFDLINVYPVNWYNNPVIYIDYELEVDLSAGDVLQYRFLIDEKADQGLQNTLTNRFRFNNSIVNAELIESEVQEGSEINFFNYIPELKADEFLNTLFNTFNLWVIDNPFQEDELIIEPRTDFFSLGGFVNWSEKLDVSRTITYKFLADSLPKRFKYSFEASEDVNSKNYLESNSIGYADFISEVSDIDITTEEQEIKTKLTPLIATNTEGLIYPKIYTQSEGSTDKGSVGNVFKIGFVSEGSGEYIIEDLSGNNTLNDYVIISELNNTVKPKFSLTFGEPDTSLNITTVPYYDLYKLFHKLTEEEKTRKGAKILECFIYLDNTDIAELDLRRVIFINGTYYRLVSIDSYNPLNYEPTKVKLLQIDNINYDYTSNDVIYKTLEGGVKVLSENRNGLVITNKNENVQIN